MQQFFAWALPSQLHGWGNEIVGYVASALVLATFSMKSMRLLRTTAIASNLAFIAYALVANMHPILMLHSILLPVNILRLAQIRLLADQGPGQTQPRMDRWGFMLRKPG